MNFDSDIWDWVSWGMGLCISHHIYRVALRCPPLVPWLYPFILPLPVRRL